MWFFLIIGIVLAYFVLSLSFTYIVHQVPRRPVKAFPDWGRVTDTKIRAMEGGELEVWRVEPDGGHQTPRGIVVLAHGWSRNRDRMVGRAKIFGKMGFTTVMHSARDHGQSSPHRFMNAPRFAQDIEAVLDWVDEPVLLYGHSIGAAAALIVSHRRPEMIQMLFLEGCYARTKEALLSLYRNYNKVFGFLFAGAVVFWMDFFYRGRLDTVSPVKLAPVIDKPVLIIHGERDQNFPLHHAWRLRDSFPGKGAELFVAAGADHSGASVTPGFEAAIRDFVGRRFPQK